MYLPSDASKNLNSAAIAPKSWTAPAKRSGDGFCTHEKSTSNRKPPPAQSGAALRFPPQIQCRLELEQTSDKYFVASQPYFSSLCVNHQT